MTSKWFDNTDPHQAEADANLLTDVLEASTEYSVIGLDLEGRILMWNEGARRLFGYEPEEVIGKANSAILYTLEDAAQDVPRQVLDSALRDGKWEDSISRRSKNGQYFTARVVITPRRNADGTPTGYLLISKEKQLRTVQVSAKLLLLLINDLLDLAKIESGKVELEFEPVTCQSVIEEVRTTLGPMADAKGLRIDVQLPPEELVVRTDRRALSQIITNLTSNAVKFTDEGSVGITLSRQGGNGSPRTVIRVRDSGRGIKPEDQARLFEAFAQMDSMTKRRNEGTGLGLHLSQKLAGLLGGHISFESQFGVGSTFTLTLTQPAA